MKIGIPRALLYYWYGQVWQDFLIQCDLDVVISPATERRTIAAGAEAGVDELCLPVKIFLGHLQELAGKVDYLLVPHLIKVEKSAYICPKFMGLPDIVAHALPQLREKLVILKVGPVETNMTQCLRKTAHRYGWRVPKTGFIVTKTPALQITQEYAAELTAPATGMTFGLLGHPYCLYDSSFNLNLFQILAREGIHILTPEMTPVIYKGMGSGKLTKDLFWTIGRSQFDALDWMLNDADHRVDGFIQVVPFACGPEAIVGDLLERRIKEAGKPYLKLYFEEHSGEAGLITRLEAFLDLVKYRSRAC